MISKIFITLAIGIFVVAVLWEPILNVIGRANGYGSCSACGGTWDHTESHTIPMGDDVAMFPVCERCYWRLSSDEVEGHIWRLVWRWKMDCLVGDCGGEDFDAEAKIAIRNMRIEKSTKRPFSFGSVGASTDAVMVYHHNSREEGA